MDKKLEKRWTVETSLEDADKFLKNVGVPIVGKPNMEDPTEETSEVYYPEAIHDMDKTTLEKLAWQFSAFKAYLEYQVGMLKAKEKAINSSIDNMMSVKLHELTQEYMKDAQKLPTKDSLRAQVIADSLQIRNRLKEQIDVQTTLVKMDSLLQAYIHLWDGVSRVITVRKDLS